jgi:non-ribosomal peptide synthetase component F
LRWAEYNPKSPAVCASDGDVSYGELDDLSFRLASYLVSIGVGRGTIVPLCFEKSMWTVVALLATLREGAAFLLLDPVGQPEARLDIILRQIGVFVLLTSPTHELRDAWHIMCLSSPTQLCGNFAGQQNMSSGFKYSLHPHSM